MGIFRRRPRTFAEYMATLAKRAQRDMMLRMCDEYEARSRVYARRHDLAWDWLHAEDGVERDHVLAMIWELDRQLGQMP